MNRSEDGVPLAHVVLDTNVFVAAGFNSRSASANILEVVRQRQVRMVWNEATRREIERILGQIPPLRVPPVAVSGPCGK